MRKSTFYICENKDADQLRSNSTAQLISVFVFATRIVQFLYLPNPKFQASSYLLWLYSRKPRRPVFSQRGSNRSPRTQIGVLARGTTKEGFSSKFFVFWKKFFVVALLLLHLT